MGLIGRSDPDFDDNDFETALDRYTQTINKDISKDKLFREIRKYFQFNSHDLDENTKINIINGLSNHLYNVLN